MIGIKQMAGKVYRISPPDDSMYFFGYYDIPAFSPDDRQHLCGRVSFMDRLPKSEDRCQLGLIDLETGNFRTFAETTAWNFQQGAMLQWLPGGNVIYNTWDGMEYGSMIQDTQGKTLRKLPLPVATVSPDGRWGLSINFNRVYDFRPGYGYCHRQDPWKDQPYPQEDGVFRVDLHSGQTKQILSYARLNEIFGRNGKKGCKIVINHITFNPASDRFVFLVRYFPQEGENWGTGFGTCDLEGNVYLLQDYTYASHYYWKDRETILIYADCGEGPALYELTDQTQHYIIHDRNFFREDIHCSYSPDRNWIIGDGYPDREHYRSIFLYHLPSQKGMLLGKVYAPPLPHFDIRSDLHCRWSHCGKLVSFDSIHEGFRGLYLMDISDAMASLG